MTRIGITGHMNLTHASAELVAEAILNNRFFVPTHPEVVEELRRRVDDWDAYLDAQIAREPDVRRG